MFLPPRLRRGTRHKTAPDEYGARVDKLGGFLFFGCGLLFGWFDEGWSRVGFGRSQKQAASTDLLDFVGGR